MNLHENSDFGRKIFFLYPPFSVETNILSKLYELEYEIYVLKDIKVAKTILRCNPDSICYINIDETIKNTITVSGWYNFVRSFEDDEILSTIFLGVLSQRASKDDKQRFLLHATIPAGFIPLNSAFEDLTNNMIEILNINGALGRRKYVRADCPVNKAKAFAIIGSRSYSMDIDNISSVGMACTVAKNQVFQVNMVLRNITLILNHKEVKINAAVLKVIPNGENYTLVLLFMKVILHSTKEIIREYIRSCLQTKIESLALNSKPDLTNYNELKLTKTTDSSAEDAETCEELEEVDELEEADEAEYLQNNSEFSKDDLSTTNLF